MCMFIAPFALRINGDGSVSDRTLYEVLLEEYGDEPGYLWADYLPEIELRKYYTFSRILYGITNISS